MWAGFELGGNKMTNKEAIETINIAMAEVEWDYPMDYTVAFEMAIDALEKMKELEKGLEDLEDTLNDAYKLNDFCLNKVIHNQSMSECECIAESFSLKVMQNLSWLLDVIKRSGKNETQINNL